jgi:hypothetical protein
VGDASSRKRFLGGYSRKQGTVLPKLSCLTCRREEAIENINNVMEDIRAEYAELAE